MNANGKAPTSLGELQKLIDSMDDGEESPEFLWLRYIHDFLTARKTYHKKQALKKKMLLKVASEQLTQDEMDAIDKQADDLTAKALQVEEETT